MKHSGCEEMRRENYSVLWLHLFTGRAYISDSYRGGCTVDVTDHDACAKLATWFDARWADKWCLDISQEVADIIDQSWARPQPIPPHHIYVKMAYHLSQEAREGIVR